MQSFGVFFALVTFVFWGVAAFLDKLAANRLGDKGTWVILLSSIPSLIFFLAYIIWFSGSNFDQKGLWILLASWILTTVGSVAYYLVFTKSQVSVGAPLTALYPVLAVILGVLFLKEKLSGSQTLGVGLGMLSIYLLSK